MKVLYLLRGLPGSGKSSFANFIWEHTAIYEADKFWYLEDGTYKFDITRLGDAHKWCQVQVEDAMKENIASAGQYFPEIVVSNTSTTEKELKPYLDLAEKYDYTVVSLVVENRHGSKNTHNVPDEVLDKMEARFSLKLR